MTSWIQRLPRDSRMDQVLRVLRLHLKAYASVHYRIVEQP